MSEVLDVSAAPSPAPVEPIAAAFDQDALSKVERQKLAAKGQLPKRIETAKPAESQPAAEPSEAKAETAPESDNGDEEEILTPEARKKSNRDWRKEVVKAKDEQIAFLKEQLAAKSASAPTPKETEAPKTGEITIPDLDDYLAEGKTAKQWQADYAKAVRAQAKADAEELFESKSKTSTLASRIRDAKKEFKDFDALVLKGDAPASTAMIAAIQSREDGMKIAYYLAQNPTEAERLSKLTTAQGPKSEARVDIEFDLISEKLAAPPAEPPAPKPVAKTLTSAPAPARPASGGGTAQADPLIAAFERGKKSGNMTEFNKIYDERTRAHMKR